MLCSYGGYKKMTREGLNAKILATYSDEEWEKLRCNEFPIPVSAFNRKTLLRLQESIPEPDTEIPEDAVSEMSGRLKAYLAKYMPDHPDAHLPIVLSCMSLAFIFSEPLHAAGQTKWIVQFPEDKAVYYCPAREEGADSLCQYCVCRKMSEWKALTAEKAAAAQRQAGLSSARIRELLLENGFLESGILHPSDLVFYPEVRSLCKQNKCGRYQTTWACPPAVGTLAECRNQCMKYEELQVFSKAFPVTDPFDFDAFQNAMHEFKGYVQRAADQIRQEFPEAMILSNESCDRCKKCTWPDSPCRFPDQLFPSIEGYGFLVSELAKKAGIRYLHGPGSVTFFGAVFYNRR
jgi:predicted metal-binding protein